MARLPRLAFAGQAHLLIQRGHNAQPVFLDDDDRESFLAVLHDAAAAEHVQLHGYVLLDNEVQLLATPAEPAGLSRLMQALGRRHGARFNRKHGHVGTLWAGRFGASAVDPQEWVLRCLRFIETAPGRSAAASTARSSAGHHLGQRHDPLVTEHRAYWALGNTPFERESAWARLLEQPLAEREIDAIEAAVRRGWPLGSVRFRGSLGESGAHRLSPRPVGRPTRYP